MELTGKCLEEFERYILKNERLNNLYKNVNVFYNLTSESERFGIFLDYFDSVGITIGFLPILEEDKIEYMVYFLSEGETQPYEMQTDNRNEIIKIAGVHRNLLLDGYHKEINKL